MVLNTITPGDKLYRAYAHWSIYWDSFLEVVYSRRPKLCFEEYNIIKETEKGFWIHVPGDNRKWVSKTAKKRFAYPTKEEAIIAFKHRKLSHVRHARKNLERAEAELSLI